MSGRNSGKDEYVKDLRLEEILVKVNMWKIYVWKNFKWKKNPWKKKFWRLPLEGCTFERRTFERLISKRLISERLCNHVREAHQRFPGTNNILLNLPKQMEKCGHREEKTSLIPKRKGNAWAQSKKTIIHTQSERIESESHQSAPKQKELKQKESKQKESNQQAPPIYYFCRLFEYFLVNFEKKLDIWWVGFYNRYSIS